MKLRKFLFLPLLAILILWAGFVYKDLRVKALSEATEITKNASALLGLNLDEFKGPNVIDGGIFGSNTYYWVKKEASTAEHLLYDSWENNLCWSKGTQNFGCIVAKDSKQ